MMRSTLSCIFTLTVVCLVGVTGTRVVPALGYSTWQWFPGTHWGKGQGQYNGVDEVTCKAQADAMVSAGLVAAGYNVFIVDEPCFAGRNSAGELQPNATRWPHGFGEFAEYLSERGMRLGIYTDAGEFTCQGCVGSKGHEEQDMETFISWNVSYVKVDRCFGVDSEEMRENLPQTFAKYRAAATKAAVPVEISAVLAATDNCWEWCNGTCDSCRTTEDIHNSWGAIQSHVDSQESIPYIADWAGPGYFNDLDMLILGNMSHPDYAGVQLTLAEVRSHIGLWAILKSPLLLSCNVTSLRPEVLQYLKNKEMLDIFHDPLAKQAKRLHAASGASIRNSLRLYFETCPKSGLLPIARQTWTLSNNGLLKSGDASKGNLQLISCDAKQSTKVCPMDPPSSCSTTPCAGGDQWMLNGSSLVNKFSSTCLQGRLGPGRSSVGLATCNQQDAQQQWSMHSDGTIRAYGQCLTVEPLAPSQLPSLDVFAGPLVDKSIAILLQNRGTQQASSTLSLTELGWAADQQAHVRDIWGQQDLPVATGQVSVSLGAHDVAFLRLTKV